MPTTPQAALGPLLVAGLAGAAHLVVGFFYLTSGLVVPLYALLPLWLVWVVLALWLVRLAILRSWWTPVVPVTAAAVLTLTLILGGTVLGWQP
ncbi:hypothetical protein FHU33_1865 [Blastococcus colisei]|uniref:Uncharacterized protein n=1 Tax=Blastococcus colisei TaxID=1564162 RepID=A0A543PEE0_9ACTN|nr:hypothetical protein [Blastococcus colisei]TQN42465.1 hypothetical protein FHU33_1865 [Blastococcus colisei]